MNTSIAHYVRSAFALFLLGTGLYAGLDSLAENALANRGLSTCGSTENPCTLAPLQVTTPASGTFAATKKAGQPAPVVVQPASSAAAES